MDIRWNFRHRSSEECQCKCFESKDVNFIDIDTIDVQKILKNRMKVFADPKEALSYSTNIVATINKENDKSIYSKLNTYPMVYPIS